MTMMNLMYSIKIMSIFREYIEEKSLSFSTSLPEYFEEILDFRTRDTLAVLDDKSHLVGMTDRYARLGLVDDESEGEYDDEYDDTYDDGIVNVRDKDDAIDNELEKNENRFVIEEEEEFFKKKRISRN